MTSCLVAINKNRDMCFDMKNGKKTYFSGEIPVNDGRNVWRGLKSIRLIKKNILRISKVSCKESSRSQSLTSTERRCKEIQSPQDLASYCPYNSVLNVWYVPVLFSRSRFTPCMSMDGGLSFWGTVNVLLPECGRY